MVPQNVRERGAEREIRFKWLIHCRDPPTTQGEPWSEMGVRGMMEVNMAVTQPQEAVTFRVCQEPQQSPTVQNLRVDRLPGKE